MNNSTQHVVWVDYLRVIACFMMVLAHACDPFVGQFNANYAEFLTGASIGSSLRACVPLFAMVSGMLLLPVQIPMEQFYRRRLTRILIPLLIWSIVTPFLYYFYVNNVTTVSPHIVVENFSWDNTINKVIFAPINFNYDTTPLWYLYMLVGLYLIMPIISDWLKNASQKTLKIFLSIWIATLFLPYLELIAPFIGYQGVWGNMGILGECAWNPYGTFYYFSGFLGYVVLAFYINKFVPRASISKTLISAVPMFLVGFGITLGGFLYVQSYYPTDYEFLEICWYFCSINVMMMTTALYLIIRNINWKEYKLVSCVAKLTFGIYLAHFILVQIGYDIFYSLGLPTIVEILSIAVFAFVATTVVVGLIKMLSKSKYIVG